MTNKGESGIVQIRKRRFYYFTFLPLARMDVVCEEVLRKVPHLKLVSDVPLPVGGWFRVILSKSPLDLIDTAST